MTGILLDTQLDPSQKSFVETIRSSGSHLLAIINDILDFSKLDAGKLELEYYAFDIRECIDEGVEIVAAGVVDKGVELLVQVDSNVPPRIMGDASRIRQVVVNLVGNAMKFTAKGEVVVNVEALPAEGASIDLHVSVCDTGIGIDSNRVGRLFTPFGQADASTSRSYGGTGLGLAISKQIVERLNGSMDVQSEPGKGSTFSFTIPVSIAPTIAASEQTASHIQGKRVLIIDDHAKSREVLRRMVESWGMIAEEAANATQAVELVRSVSFDVALVDFSLPEMNGIELTRILQKLPGATSLPCALLGSKSTLDEAATESRFAFRLVKPIRESSLLQQISDLLTDARPSQVPPARASTKSIGEAHPLRILVAEDNAVNQKVALLFLQKLGYRADVVSNGREAIAAVERLPYDVVLMDVQMPEIDGLEATRAILARPSSTPHPQIIAMTAHAISGDRERCLEAGMVDYVNKPVELVTLRGALLRAASKLRKSPSITPIPHVELPAPDVRLFAPERVESLRQLSELTGDDILADLRQALDEDCKKSIAALHEAISNGDSKKLERTAHSFKSTCANVGGERVAALCQRLEHRGNNGIIDDATQLVSSIESELALFLQELDAYLASTKKTNQLH